MCASETYHLDCSLAMGLANVPEASYRPRVGVQSRTSSSLSRMGALFAHAHVRGPRDYIISTAIAFLVRFAAGLRASAVGCQVFRLDGLELSGLVWHGIIVL